MMISFSIFQKITSPVGVAVSCDWKEFANKYLINFETRANKDGRLYSPAIYPPDNVRRGDANIIGLSAIALDFDNSRGRGLDAKPIDRQTTPDDLKTNLEGITYAVHSTYSHDLKWIKFRIVIPFSKIVTPDQYRLIANYVVYRLLGNDDGIDKTSTEISRAFYCPSCPAEKLEMSFSALEPGNALDVDEILANNTTPMTNVIPLNPILQVPTAHAGRNDALKSQVGAMLAKNTTIDQMVAELVTYDNKHHNPPLFADSSEGMRADPWTNALKFIANNITSINHRRLTGGMEAQTTIIGPAGFEFLDMDLLMSKLGPINWIMKGILEADITGVLFGYLGAAKSFTAISLACSVATGKSWLGKYDIKKQGPTYYVAGEGHNGLARRFAAWAAHHKTNLSDYPLHVSKTAAQLMDEKSVLAVYKTIDRDMQKTGEPPVFILFDTLARNFGEGDENSNSDMNRLFDNVERYLREPTGANVMLVHHSGKDVQKGPRGASSLPCNSGYEFHQFKDLVGGITLKNTKTKDGADGYEIPLSTPCVGLGIFDDENEEATSLVIAPGVDLPVNDRASKKEIEALNVLDDLLETRRETLISSNYDPITARVTTAEWRDELAAVGLLGKNQKQTFYRLRKELTELGKITSEGPYVRISTI